MSAWMLWALLAAGLPVLAADKAQEQARDAEAKAKDGAKAAAEEARDAARADRDRAREARDKAREEARKRVDQHREAARRARDERQAERDRLAALYEQATEALYDKQWEQAVKGFAEVARVASRRADAALYWKAYAEAKSGRAAEALATLDALRAQWPGSRWQRQARALALEIRPGDAPADTGGDDDLRLLALGRLLDTDKAIPALEKILAEPSSHRAKERALFLLSQSEMPEARQLLLRIARGEAHPRLQKKAIEYVGIFGSAESRRVLEAVYAGAASTEVKRAVLRGYMLSGNKAGVLGAAQSETNASLRAEAVRQLGLMGARRELVALLGRETDAEAKKAVLHALFLTGDAEKLIELSRTEKDPAVRAEAVRTLGLLDRQKTGPALVAICRESKDPGLRKQAVNALFLQGNDQALVEIARTEKDPAVRREAVLHLSHLDSSLSREFLAELLGK